MTEHDKDLQRYSQEFQKNRKRLEKLLAASNQNLRGDLFTAGGSAYLDSTTSNGDNLGVSPAGQSLKEFLKLYKEDPDNK